MKRDRNIRAIVFIAMLAGIGSLVGNSVYAAPLVTVFTAGVNDNFALPTEPTSPSDDLLLLMDTYGGGDRVRFPHRQFDDVNSNRFFGHTFTDLPEGICTATLEITMRFGGSNDGIALERTGINDAFSSWYLRLANLFNLDTGLWWNLGTDHTFILDLANLPPDGNGDTNIIPFMNADHALDVYVQDDSGVDYMILTVTSNCVSIDIPIDIKPQSCPNPVNVRSAGVLPVAILGTADFDVTTVDPASIRILGVAPLKSALEDTATPFEPFVGKESEVDCTVEGPDAFLDLTLSFNTQEIVQAIEASLGRDVEDGEALVLLLEGELSDGTSFVGEDVVVILNRTPGRRPGG